MLRESLSRFLQSGFNACRINEKQDGRYYFSANERPMMIA
jgi:hypothetical protein